MAVPTKFEIKVNTTTVVIERKKTAEIMAARRKHGAKKQKNSSVLGVTLPTVLAKEPTVELEVVKIGGISYIGVTKVSYTITLSLRVMTDIKINNTLEGRRCLMHVNAHEMRHVHVWRTTMNGFLKKIPGTVLKAVEPVLFDHNITPKTKLKKIKAEKMKKITKALDDALNEHMDLCSKRSEKTHSAAEWKKGQDLCGIFLPMNTGP